MGWGLSGLPVARFHFCSYTILGWFSVLSKLYWMWVRVRFHGFCCFWLTNPLYRLYISAERKEMQSPWWQQEQAALSQSLGVYLFGAGSHEQNIIVLALYFILSSLPLPLFKVTLYFGPKPWLLFWYITSDRKVVLYLKRLPGRPPLLSLCLAKCVFTNGWAATES